jgi:hypothetical protein
MLEIEQEAPDAFDECCIPRAFGFVIFFERPKIIIALNSIQPPASK